MLLKRSDVGAAMTLVDCKRYNASNKVGVEVVRGLYGVVEAQKATGGMIVTTSTFTSGAKKFRDELKYRMGLTDLNDIRGLLRDWRK
jgi:restriction endonuclease Mrr